MIVKFALQLFEKILQTNNFFTGAAFAVAAVWQNRVKMLRVRLSVTLVIRRMFVCYLIC